MQYKTLTIEATNPTTTIFLVDNQNNLVQQDIGFMQTSILPGIYFIQFGYTGEKTRIDFTNDLEIIQ